MVKAYYNEHYIKQLLRPKNGRLLGNNWAKRLIWATRHQTMLNLLIIKCIL
jgi:hypothetical protein